MFTKDLTEVFNPGSEEGAFAFNELKQAYVNVRYKDAYQADGELVKDIHAVVCEFNKMVEDIYLKHRNVNRL